MKVKELISVVFDKVVIYKSKNEGIEDIYENIYEGNTNDIPLDILEMKVRIIGARKKNVIDIQVL